MTKQERRELQEQQRAAKQAKKEAEAQASTKAKPAKAQSAPPTSTTPSPAGVAGAGPAATPSKEAKSTASVKEPPAKAAPSGVKQPAPSPGPHHTRQPGTKDTQHQSAKAAKRGRLDLTDLHPAILRLGIQYQTHEIRGGNARCIAMLQALKQVIQDYTPPQAETKPNHGRDVVQALNKPIQFLINCRKLSVSMGNAIAGLKHKINTTCDAEKDISLDDLKKTVSQYIDMFIYERIVDADRFITSHGVNKVAEGDAILTFGRSSAVEMILRTAKQEGRKFTVCVVDSGPAFEGKSFAQRLALHGISCTYILLTALSNVIGEVTKVFIGAAGVLTNGSVYSRIGTAMVCLMASHYQKPVLCCCETYKFTDKAWFNSLTSNEEGNPDDLMVNDDAGAASQLGDWRKQENLSLVNMQYDLTPPEYITMLITEVGMIPPTSVPVIIREYHLKVSDS
eukprot:GGOE01014471.1.p1 GENE.GGOE01014471.1~~GGOE01014471.1.p1  ORF type:complete len:482 (-),score=117.84 GGOE01014471.1:184-1539(-)